jgi:hypothetical protein
MVRYLSTHFNDIWLNDMRALWPTRRIWVLEAVYAFTLVVNLRCSGQEHE